MLIVISYFNKHDLSLLPVRHHNELTVRGYLFMQFLSLIIYISMREKIIACSTIEQALLTLRKLKSKVFKDKIIPLEITKQHKAIFNASTILVPNFL